MKTYPIYLLSAILLAGLGIYYLFFKFEEYFWWTLMFGGSAFNLFLAYKAKEQEEK